jgi:hypothetical protein
MLTTIQYTRAISATATMNNVMGIFSYGDGTAHAAPRPAIDPGMPVVMTMGNRIKKRPTRSCSSQTPSGIYRQEGWLRSKIQAITIGNETISYYQVTFEEQNPRSLS